MPTNHRPNDDACLTVPPAGYCVEPGMCNSDSACVPGTNGRCVDPGGELPVCRCMYDTCAQDSSCPTGETCACRGSLYSNGFNACVQGNCRVDADCGANGYCSPAVATDSCRALLGYYCHTPDDECVDNTDCTGWCTYVPTDGRWECKQPGICG